MRLGLSLALTQPRGAAAPVLDRLVVCVGDSLTYGTGATTPGGAGSYPYQLATALGLTYGTDVVNLGVPSLGVDDLVEPDYLLDETKQCHLVVFIGVNNIYPADQTPAAVWSSLSTYLAARAARGWVVHVCTLTGNNIDAADRPDAITLDASISGSGYHVVDLASNGPIGTVPTGLATHYDADGLHLNDTGYAVLSGLVQSSIQSVNGSAPTYSTAYGYAIDSGLTGYWRDWRAVSPSDPSSEVNPGFYSLAAKAIGSRALVASGTFGDREVSGGHFALSLLGAGTQGDAFYTTSGETLATYLGANALCIRMVIDVTNVNTTGAAPYLSDCILGDSNNYFGVFVWDNAGTPTITLYVYNGGAKYCSLTMTVGSYVFVEFSFNGTNLRGRVGLASGLTTGDACTQIDDRTGAIRVARGPTGVLGTFKLRQLAIRNDNGDSVRTAFDASDTARWGAI